MVPDDKKLDDEKLITMGHSLAIDVCVDVVLPV
jgi:hypothetical protein